MDAAPFTLKRCAPELLRAAVRALFDAPREADPCLPSAARMHAIAEQTVRTGQGDDARSFQALLELGYLVASADGLADGERTALAEMLEQVTGRGVDHETLRVHFADLDATCAALGRSERLRRAAADVEDTTAREEALAFAALVALSDGEIAEPEMRALTELGDCFGMPADRVRASVAALVAAVERRIP